MCALAAIQPHEAERHRFGGTKRMLGIKCLHIKQINCLVCSKSTSTVYFPLVVISGSLVFRKVTRRVN